MSEVLSNLFIIIMKFSKNILSWDDVETFIKQFLTDQQYKPVENIVKGLEVGANFANFMISKGRNKEDDLDQISGALNIDNNIVKDMSALCTDNYYKQFSPSRMEQLQDSNLVKILSNKLRLDNDQLMGLIELFFNQNRTNYDQSRYIQAYLEGIYKYANVTDEAEKQTIKQVL